MEQTFLNWWPVILTVASLVWGLIIYIFHNKITELSNKNIDAREDFRKDIVSLKEVFRSEHREFDKRIQGLGKRVDANVRDIKDISEIKTDVEVIKTQLTTLTRLVESFFKNFLKDNKDK